MRIDPHSFGIAGISGIPNAYWAMLVTPGLILYVDEQKLIKAGITLSSVAVGEYFFEQYKKARNRPDGGLLPNPQPGISQSPDESCSILDFLNSLLQYSIPLPGWLE